MAADQVVLGVAEHVQDAGAGVGRPQLGQHRGSRLGPPVDPAVGLPARRPGLPGHTGPAVVQRHRPEPARREPGHGQQYRPRRGVRHFGPVHRALRAARHRELRAGPDIARVHLRVRLQHGDTPPPGAAHDRPVQRGRPPVTHRPRMHDQAWPGRPDVRRNRRGQHRRDDKIRIKKPDALPQHLIPQRQLDGHLMPAVRQLRMHPLRHTVITAGNQQDPHQRSPSAGRTGTSRAPPSRPRRAPRYPSLKRTRPTRS